MIPLLHVFFLTLFTFISLEIKWMFQMFMPIIWLRPTKNIQWNTKNEINMRKKKCRVPGNRLTRFMYKTDFRLACVSTFLVFGQNIFAACVFVYTNKRAVLKLSKHIW